MQLSIRLFAGLADKLGTSILRLNVPEQTITGAALKALLADSYPEAAVTLRSCFIAKNQEYADDEAALSAEDEIALIPPVSGGEGPPASSEAVTAPEFSMGRHTITELPISVEDVCARAADDEHGAALAFIGTTRRTTHGRRTVLLEYEAYVPMALRTLRQIEEELAARIPGTRCAIAHRIGSVPVGETSVVIAVSTPHRADCYEASRYAIERLKQIVPIWKKEVWEDGSEWKGPQGGTWNPLAADSEPS